MSGWKIVALAIIALGIGVRFVNLEKKTYWMDEAFTSLRVSGYRGSEVRAEVMNGKEITAADLYKYGHVNPDRNVFYTVLSLVTSPHPPFYFVLARVWAGIVGDSLASLRLLSAVFGVLIIPCIYWLCLELFRSPLTGWIAMILVAVSPFHLLYAQEARPYSLFALITIVSTAVLLRANRLQRPLLWWFYAAVIAVGLYTHLFFAATLLAHGMYIFISTWREQGITRKTWPVLKPFLLAGAAGILAFVPWIIVIIRHSRQIEATTRWLRDHRGLMVLIRSWGAGVCSVFVDPICEPSESWNYLVRLPTLLLIGYALYYLWRTTSMRSSLPVFALILCTAVTMIAPDLISGGRRSMVWRYWVPAYIGLQIAVAHLLAIQLSNARPTWQRFWRTITGTVITAGVVSCAVILEAESWWNKGDGLESRKIAHILNQADRPLLINGSPHGMGTILAMAPILNENVRMRFSEEPSVPPHPERFKEIFVMLNPSETMRQELERINDNRTLVPIMHNLWQWKDKQEAGRAGDR